MRVAALAVMSVAVAGGGEAQQRQEPATSQTIVVQGVRDRNRQIDRFVHALTDAPIGGQISRFDAEFCPVALGLSEYQNSAITERMRRVAAAAGLRIGRAGCRPNAFLIVAGDKRGFLKALYKKRPDFFENQDGWKRKLVIEPGPVSAWHVEGLLDANGIQPIGAAGRDGEPLGYSVVNSMDSSRLLPASIPYFAAGFVVVEIEALRGISITQLADYAAMRIFTRFDPKALAKTSAPTILRLLETPFGGAAPITLTEWDMSFLKGLYSSDSRKFANRQRNEIRRSVRRDLDRPRSKQE
jgi:hypothetical protein